MSNRKYDKKYLDFIQKMRFKYRVSIVNENTLEETWHTRLSRLSVFITTFSLFLLTFLIFTLLIFLTPIRHYLPGYGDSGNRADIVALSVRADSLQSAVNLQSAYLNVLKGIIKDTPQTDSLAQLDSSALSKQAKIVIEKNAQEANFVEKYETLEKYNLANTTTVNKNEKKMEVFYRPVQGVVAMRYSPKDEKFGISIITSPQENVMSVLEGTIISTSFTLEKHWIIVIQHPNSYISVYKNNTRLLKQSGDVVKAGETIAITGSNDPKVLEDNFYLEIWQNGESINPEELITF